MTPPTPAWSRMVTSVAAISKFLPTCPCREQWLLGRFQIKLAHAVYSSFPFEIRKTQGGLGTFVLVINHESDDKTLGHEGFMKAKCWDQPTSNY